MDRVEHQIEVELPVRTVYNQWTQLESFPSFMEGVERVDQLSATRTHWVAEVAGIHREWDAEITRQEPDRLIEWTGFGGADNVGVIEFESVSPDRTTVRVGLEWKPEGALENVAGALGIVSRRVSDDLARFKRFVEGLGAETGGWRGEIAPDVPTGEVPR